MAQLPVPDGGSWVGPYTPIPLHQSGGSSHCCEIAHAILIGKPGPAQGKVLLIMSNGYRYIWDPASPNSVSGEYLCDAIPPSRDMFCAGHSADGNGDIVIHGGNRHIDLNPTVCYPQPIWSFLYEAGTMCWSGERSMIIPSVSLSSYDPGNDDDNFGYWYPGSTRLPDGRVISVGGGSAPMNTTLCNDTGWIYFIDGWQIFQPSLNAWEGKAAGIWFNGLQANTGSTPLSPPASSATPAFNYYPLLMTLPRYPVDATGFVYSPVVTNNRSANNLASPSYVPVASVSARMDLGGSWPNNSTPWVVTSQIMRPGTSIPRNLFYPSGLPRPLVLDNQGKPTGPAKAMIIAGTDNNIAPDTHATVGGRAALAEVSQITGPDQPGAPWSSNGAAFPNLIHPRIYANAVYLPNGEIFVVGGSTHDFFPYSGVTPLGLVLNWERVADPIYEPELLDAFSSGTPWRVGAPHVSPRLYHSVAVLLADGRVLVGGGYRGDALSTIANRFSNWHEHDPSRIPPVANPHSDFEIYSPEYLFAGARPEILDLKVLNTSTNQIPFATSFELTIRRDNIPNAISEIGIVCLVSCASVTHHFDWDQRYVRLNWNPSAASPTTKMIVNAPFNGTVVPPGWYMLFVNTSENVTNWRIPSIAKYVKIG